MHRFQACASVDLALQSGAEGPANLPFPGKVAAPKGTMRPIYDGDIAVEYIGDQLSCVIDQQVFSSPIMSFDFLDATGLQLDSD